MESTRLRQLVGIIFLGTITEQQVSASLSCDERRGERQHGMAGDRKKASVRPAPGPKTVYCERMSSSAGVCHQGVSCALYFV